MSINKCTVMVFAVSTLVISGCSSNSSDKAVDASPEQPVYTLVDQVKDAYSERVDSGWGVSDNIENPIEKGPTPSTPNYTLAEQLKDAYAARVDGEWGLSATPTNPIEHDKELPIYNQPENPIEIEKELPIYVEIENPIETPDYGDTPEFGLYKVVYDAESGQLKVYDRRNEDATVAIVTVEESTVVVRHGAMEDDNTYALKLTENGIAIDWESPYTKIDSGFTNPLSTESMVALMNRPALTQQQIATMKAKINTQKVNVNRQSISQMKLKKSQLKTSQALR